ncbi:MAG: hypothetical protein AAF252_02870 [Pseudomonadota bacterium]
MTTHSRLFESAVRKLGWLSSYSRQALLSRHLLRSLQDHEVANGLAWNASDRLLLDCFRAVVSALSGENRVAQKFSAPYEPSDRPDTCYLAFSRRQRLFEVSIASGEPSLAFHHQHGIVGWENSTEVALEDIVFIDETRRLGKGVSLFNKQVADDRVSILRNEKLFGDNLRTNELNTHVLDWWYPNQPEETEFWKRWYKGFLVGAPLNWEFQRKVAQIDDSTWDQGIKAVANAIREIEAHFLVESLPQIEEVFQADSGLYDVRTSFSDPIVLIESIENRVRFALGLAVESNACDLNAMSTAAKVLRHALDNCLDDPNALEQFLRRASDMIKARIADGSFSGDDELGLLTKTLDEMALQLRADHPDVAAAVDARSEQSVRELDDARRLEGVKLIEGLREGTEVRLNAELGLASETVQDGSSSKATADALKQSGNRAAKISISERAKKAEGSGAMSALKIGMRAEKLVEFLTNLISGGGAA